MIVKTQPSSGFGVRELVGGMAVATLLLGAGAMDLTLAGPKWMFGDCQCQARPTLSSSISYGLPRRAEEALPAAYAASPLPVAGPEMAGMKVGAEPEARLALQAFPGADLYRSDETQPQQAAVAGPRANYDWRTTGAGAGDPNVGRIFADAPGLESSDDSLMPARSR